MRQLLTVQHCSAVEGRGVVASGLANVDVGDLWLYGQLTRLELRLPDGSRRPAVGTVVLPRAPPASRWLLVSVWLRDEPNAAVPIGTELWVDEVPPNAA